MKKVLLAVCLMFGGATLVSAQSDPASSSSQTQTQTQDQEGQQISASELPDAVTAKLEGQDYSGWTVGNAYKKMDDSNQEMYVVELRQGTETKKVKFDRDGNEVDKGKHGDKSDANYRSGESGQTDQSTPGQTETPGQTDQSTTTPGQTDQSTTTPGQTDQSTTTPGQTDQSTTDQSTQSTTDQADNSSTGAERP